tara:strand:+ start:994 stop:1230 length:237 start_codon:yes stop_codon:yes gene_type:complete
MNKILEDLHKTLAQELLDRIKSGEEKASILNVARQFLKDNGIEALPVADSPLKSLIDELPFDTEDEEETIQPLQITSK